MLAAPYLNFITDEESPRLKSNEKMDQQHSIVISQKTIVSPTLYIGQLGCIVADMKVVCRI